jgi:Mor family transcriptional regulator
VSAVSDVASDLTPGQREDSAMVLLHELTTVLREEVGLNEHLATEFAKAVLQGLRRRLGSQHVYIPGPDRTALYQRVLKEFTGRNHDELASRHGLSRATIYRITRRP